MDSIEGNFTGMDLLIIEDSATQAEQLKYMLEKHNYQVRVASNGNAALSMVNESKPDIIVTDIMMPEFDGFAVCRKIKEDERLKDIPIIILTSLADSHDVIKGLECGADAFFTKPCDEEYFLARIEHLKKDRNKPRCISMPKDMDISIDGRNYKISADRRQILNLFLSTYESAFQKNQELLKAKEELRELSDKLQASNVELEVTITELNSANRELEAFTYRVAHDLRNPLNAISGCSQAVMQFCGKQLDEQCKNFVNEITNRSFSMSELINALLDLSKMKHVEVKREKVDLSNMAKVIAGEFQIRETNRKVTFEIEEGLTVNGDEKLLWLVLENLIGNAWKYSSNKEETKIAFGMTMIKEKPTFFVRDNGEGFEMHDADKLFTPFQRLSKNHEGHGIGLATVHRIIKHHNGKIWAEGEPGQGATFYFAF